MTTGPSQAAGMPVPVTWLAARGWRLVAGGEPLAAEQGFDAWEFGVRTVLGPPWPE